MKETPKALSSGSCLLRTYAAAHVRMMSKERLARRGISLIPNDVLLSTSPIRGTVATLIPTESAALSIPSSPLFAGNSKATRAYPGRNRTSGRPRTVRIKLSLSTGMSTKISVRITRPITNSRSDGTSGFRPYDSS